MAKKIFSFIFLFIFFAKMVISVAPLIAVTLDAKSVHAVIMQLEIEHGPSKGEAKAKEVVKDYYQNHDLCLLTDSETCLSIKLSELDSLMHHQGFYPAVPTPPPNA